MLAEKGSPAPLSRPAAFGNSPRRRWEVTKELPRVTGTGSACPARSSERERRKPQPPLSSFLRLGWRLSEIPRTGRTELSLGAR
jgi:hypothetical protein